MTTLLPTLVILLPILKLSPVLLTPTSVAVTTLVTITTTAAATTTDPTMKSSDNVLPFANSLPDNGRGERSQVMFSNSLFLDSTNYGELTI